MQMDPRPPDFSGVKYTAGTMDIGSGYAAGITQAGKSLSSAITGAADIMKQRQDASDTLTAMHQTGMLKDDEYKAIYGKSLGAQQAMLGTYASQWIAQQAQTRALQQQGYGANLDVWKQHLAMVDEVAKLQATRPQTLPMNVQQPNQPQSQSPRALPPNAAPPVQQAQPVQQPGQYRIGPAWTGGLPPVYKSGSMQINGKPTGGILVPAQQAPLGGQPVDWTFHPSYG